ncbi:MAG: hypothetical protein K5639_02705 [Eubacterium sp.]|nr:hypothetical protein [Eubacterium sp.]
MTSVASHAASEFDEGGPEVSTGASSRPSFVRLAGISEAERWCYKSPYNSTSGK